MQQISVFNVLNKSHEHDQAEHHKGRSHRMCFCILHCQIFFLSKIGPLGLKQFVTGVPLKGTFSFPRGSSYPILLVFLHNFSCTLILSLAFSLCPQKTRIITIWQQKRWCDGIYKAYTSPGDTGACTDGGPSPTGARTHRPTTPWGPLIHEMHLATDLWSLTSQLYSSGWLQIYKQQSAWKVAEQQQRERESRGGRFDQLICAIVFLASSFVRTTVCKIYLFV